MTEVNQFDKSKFVAQEVNRVQAAARAMSAFADALLSKPKKAPRGTAGSTAEMPPTLDNRSGSGLTP